MASKGETSHPKSIPSKQTFEIGRALVELQDEEAHSKGCRSKGIHTTKPLSIRLRCSSS